MSGAAHDDAVGRLHALLVRAARFEVGRRRHALAHLRGNELDDIAMQAADDALMSVLRRLDDFRGAQPLHDLGLQVRAARGGGEAAPARLAGPRGAPWSPRAGRVFASEQHTPHEDAEQGQVLRALTRAIHEALTPHQREVLVALALNGVPIDVLAERLGTTRGALYKTLHDARRKLRAELTGSGIAPDWLERTTLMDRPDIAEALERLLGPGRPEIGCEECFASLDRYVELELAGARRRRGDPRHAAPSRRVPRLPRGSREPARARRRGRGATSGG